MTRVKSKKKLQLKKSVVRKLGDGALDGVNGGIYVVAYSARCETGGGTSACATVGCDPPATYTCNGCYMP